MNKRPIERKVFRVQARQARARDAVKCNLRSGKRMSKKKKPPTELYVEGTFTEDRAVRTEELQRPCEEQNGDEDETTEKQEEIIMQFKAEGDRHDTEDERGSLKSQLTWRVAEDKVNVPENSIVTEMIKQL